MAALLEQPRVGGMQVLKLLQRRERLRHPLQVPQRDGAHVEQVAVSRSMPRAGAPRRPGIVEAMLFDQLLQLAQVGIGSRRHAAE